jgi:Uma2 family endonuclease
MPFFRKKSMISEKRIVLPKVSWQKLEAVVTELGPEREVHLTYDRGKLEMMTPLDLHLRGDRLLESLLLVVADEADEQLANLGSILFMKPADDRAIQPFSAYYLDHPPRPITTRELDLTDLIAPDLAIDIMIKEGSMNRLSIFETMGVPEVWAYTLEEQEDSLKGVLALWGLTDRGYQPLSSSILFPFLSLDRIDQFLSESELLGLSQALALLRSWAESAIGVRPD